MLRKHIDINTMITKGPFSDVSNSFLFGFSTTFISVISVLILIIVIYRMTNQMNLIKTETSEFIVFVKHYLRQQKFILPLYYDLAFRKKNKIDNDEASEKPTFVIPPLDTGHCELMMEEAAIPTPPSSLTRRKTMSSTNLTAVSNEGYFTIGAGK